MPLLSGSAESQSLQNLVGTEGEIGLWACRYLLCNRPAYAFVYRSQQNGVDVALIRPAAYDCHGPDLSALVDLVSHGCEQVGTGKEGVEVGHHAVLPDKGMGPVQVGIKGASHHLAPVVDAAGYGGKISRQRLQASECAVLPKRAILGCAVRAPDGPNNLVQVVIAEGDPAMSVVRKRGGSAVCPGDGVSNRLAAVVRLSYGVA